MSFTKEVTIWCDGDDCDAWTYGTAEPGASITEARRNANAAGWSCSSRRDLCPACKVAAR